MRKFILFSVMCILIGWVGMDVYLFLCKPVKYHVADWTPRKPYEDYFREERGMKNPKIFNVCIRHSTLQVGARDENGIQEWDFIPLSVNKD